jgi:tRNA pseudouridine55 synthase
MPSPGSGTVGAETIGMVVVDKEAGWTSHDAVARCRRIFSQRRVGHAGTLDPDATGVLLVGLGRFTRMLRFLTGRATSTLDASGEVTGTWDVTGVTLAEVRKGAASLTGVIDQVPPMVSARKVGGRRLHELARAGIEVERAARPVTVERFDVEQSPEAGVFRIEVDCSTGTYVRVLAADLGEALGGGAHLRNLRRTRIGSFGVDEATTLGAVTDAQVLSPAQALRDMSQVELDEEMARSVSHGLALDRVSVGAAGEGPWALLDHSGALLAVYEATGTDRLVAVCVLAGSG